MCSVNDKVLIRACKTEGRALITLDMGFTNTLVFDPSQYPGIAVLRLPSSGTLEDVHAGVRTLIAGLARADIAGKLWVIRRRRIREYQPDQS